ncbi:hypothetical protein Q4603_02940 [Zobellia galactanivorans]|uniref:hypothetical protein n=1 Tax=Zobellia galactanivorans (strain DSM 12802 / CCUG 47099 / CIP 106680 / NCIMB 13871 / Dsij) TaxID=63186 RepID=UPI0026E2DA51|nr:hypothetical protein [Zobellia galactanivorans]MDO6807544.1 hypothetical protein [Zobellia galactanivorans]
MHCAKQNSAKVLKSRLIKYMALIIALCYIINPLHQQIQTVLHEVSHILTIPDNLISHASVTEKHHRAHQHSGQETLHQHEFIDVFSALFDASDEEGHHDEELHADFKFDKHLVKDSDDYDSIVFTEPRTTYFCFDNFLESSYYNAIEEPPKPIWPYFF